MELKALSMGISVLFGGGVPNHPCGVERDGCALLGAITKRFLIIRVELKVKGGRDGKKRRREVPNHPCGVERFLITA